MLGPLSDLKGREDDASLMLVSEGISVRLKNR